MGEFVEVEDCRLFTDVRGEPGRPWLVLSNSVASDHTMWDGQMDWLTATHRVVRYDTRGHGASGSPAGPAIFPQLVADAVAVLDHYGIDQTTFMGLSLGGMTGLGIALSYPERLTRLVCCDARADAPEAVVRDWDKRMAKVSAAGMPSILPETLDRWLSQRFRDANPGPVGDISAMILRTSVAGYIACGLALQKLAYREHLNRITTPTLFVAGANDPAAPVAVMREMADAVPGARFALVPNVRHLANVDNPAGFREAVEGFLAT